MAGQIFIKEGIGRWRPVQPSDFDNTNQDGLGELLQLLSEDGSVLEFEHDLPEGAGIPDERWEEHRLTHPIFRDGRWVD